MPAGRSAGSKASRTSCGRLGEKEIDRIRIVRKMKSPSSLPTISPGSDYQWSSNKLGTWSSFSCSSSLTCAFVVSQVRVSNLAPLKRANESRETRLAACHLGADKSNATAAGSEPPPARATGREHAACACCLSSASS